MNLSETQARTLDAAVDTLIPPDDYPGATAAGVPDFLLRLLERDVPSLQVVYLAGLDGLEAEAQARYQSAFASLSLPQRTELIAALEAGEERPQGNWGVDAGHFLRTLIQQTAEGYYSDPGNGGNKDALSWKMIGFGEGPDRDYSAPATPDFGRVNVQ